MLRAIEVENDGASQGGLDEDVHTISEEALAVDWLSPEEDEAWVRLHRGR